MAGEVGRNVGHTCCGAMLNGIVCDGWWFVIDGVSGVSVFVLYHCCCSVKHSSLVNYNCCLTLPSQALFPILVRHFALLSSTDSK